MSEAAKWLARVLNLLPLIDRLWKAVDSGDKADELDAQLALVRAMKDQQARETIGQ